MIQVFKTDEEYVKWLDGQRLPSGIVVYVSDDETMYFSTNNIKGELKTYKCEKEEVIDPSDPTEPSEPTKYPPLIYSAKSAGSTITVNGETVTLEQGDNIELNYPNEITSVKATSNTALTYIQIPNTVTSIEDGDYNTGSFYKCTALASVSLPDTMTMIGNYAFSGCDALGSVTLHEGIKNIGVGAFNDCTSLLSITIPESVTSISRHTFSGCHALGSVTLPNTLVSIGDSAFSSCSSLVSITIPEGVTSIGLQAFSGCHALGSVTLPNTLVSIGKRAFAICEKLTDFNYNGTMSQWGAITLGTDWNKDAAFTVVHCTDGDVSLEEPIQPIQPNNLVYSAKSAGSTITVNGETVTLEQGDNIELNYPNEITSVKATDNTALTAITMPNTMTFINGSAFKNCYYLTNINMPNTITVINPQAFRDCINLINITIPENVKNIYDFAFMGCTKLSDFNYNGTTAQWASITLGTDWNFNSAFTVVHCTDGDVTL